MFVFFGNEDQVKSRWKSLFKKLYWSVGDIHDDQAYRKYLGIAKNQTILGKTLESALEMFVECRKCLINIKTEVFKIKSDISKNVYLDL